MSENKSKTASVEIFYFIFQNVTIFARADTLRHWSMSTVGAGSIWKSVWSL